MIGVDVNKKFVSVVIPTYNRKEQITKTLISLFNQIYPKNKYEIIVVDDGSNDGTEMVIKELIKTSPCKIKYYKQKNKGPAAARNLGISKAEGDLILFTDDDCILTESWIDNIISGYTSPRIGGVGGPLKISANENNIISQYYSFHKINETPPFINNDELAFLITGNASYKKDLLIKVGGFDETFNAPGGEDPELSYRIRKLAYTLIYKTDAIVYHYKNYSLRDFLKMSYNYGRGHVILMKKQGYIFRLPYGAARFFISILLISINCYKYYKKGEKCLHIIIFPFLDSLGLLSHLIGRIRESINQKVFIL